MTAGVTSGAAPSWVTLGAATETSRLRFCFENLTVESSQSPYKPGAEPWMFAYSSKGLSHCKEEDTPEPYLEQTIDAFLRLVEKTVAAVAAG